MYAGCLLSGESVALLSLATLGRTFEVECARIQFWDRIDRHWLAEIEALRDIAVQCLQYMYLLQFFDTFRHGVSL